MFGFVRVAAGEPPLAVSAGAGTARVVAFSALIAGSSWFARAYATLPPGEPAVNLSAGIGLAGVLLSGNRLWPGVVLGALFADAGRLIGGEPVEIAVALAIAFAAALQAVLGAALFRWVAGSNDPFHRAWDAGWFVVLAAGLGCLVHPTVTVAAESLAPSGSWQAWRERWLALWLADNSGVLLAAPFVIAWIQGRRSAFGPWQGPEMVLLTAAPAAVCVLVRRTGYPLEYLYLPPIAWACFRFGPRGGTTAAAMVAVFAVAVTAHGHGSFIGSSPAVTRLLLSSFLGMVGACTLVLLGVIAQRDAAEHDLADARATFETRVRIRTQELAATNGRLRRIADLDGLTSIPNRRHFDRSLEIEWRRAERSRQPLAVVLIDVDHFKLFNDTYGHPAGDDCLQIIAETLTKGLQRGGEMLARYGGEEFVALLPNADGTAAVRVAERLRQRIAALAITHNLPAVGGCVTVSAGVASEVPTRSRRPQQLLTDADAGLYSAKHAGRNCVVRGPCVRPASIGAIPGAIAPSPAPDDSVHA